MTFKLKVTVNPETPRKGKWYPRKGKPRRTTAGQTVTKVTANGTKEPFTFVLTLIENPERKP